MKTTRILSVLFVSVFSLLITSMAGATPAVALGVAATLNTLQYVSSFYPRPFGALFSAIDITELATNLGDYHREHRDRLSAELLLDESFADKFEIMDDVTDEVPLPNLSISDLIKPANPNTFAPTANALGFGSRTLKVRGIKVDLQLVPQVLEKTWLGKMKNPSDPFDMPFEDFIMQYINSKIKENLLLQAVYGGTYNASGTTPAATMDGFLTKIAAEITATNITPVATGAITATNVIDSLETVYDGLGEAYKNVPTEMKVNTQIFDWYNRRYRTSYGANNNYEGMKMGRILLDGTNCEVVREPGLGASQRVICTPKENLVMGVDSMGGYNMDIQKFDRTIKILVDFKAGVELKEIHARGLQVNDQA